MELNKDKLKHLRESKAWSQSHLAEVAGLSLRTIQRIEKTVSHRLSLSKLFVQVTVSRRVIY